jgi:hypothetical protein
VPPYVHAALTTRAALAALPFIQAVLPYAQATLTCCACASSKTDASHANRSKKMSWEKEKEEEKGQHLFLEEICIGRVSFYE